MSVILLSVTVGFMLDDSCITNVEFGISLSQTEGKNGPKGDDG